MILTILILTMMVGEERQQAGPRARGGTADCPTVAYPSQPRKEVPEGDGLEQVQGEVCEGLQGVMMFKNWTNFTKQNQ